MVEDESSYKTGGTITPFDDEDDQPLPAFAPDLRGYDNNDFNEFRLQAARENISRFAALVCCLTGGTKDADRAWARDPSLQDLVPVLQKVKEGGGVVDIGAGLGEPAAGMLLELRSRLKLKETKYLITDIGTFYAGMADDTDVLGYQLQQKPGSVIWVDEPEDFYTRWSGASLGTYNWQDIRNRVLREYGEAWDATKPEFFTQARKSLGDQEIGLMMLRHPEIGNADQPKLTIVFTDIIHNLLTQAVRSGTPVLITTSNNELSQGNIQRAIDSFWTTQDPDLKDQWQVLRREMPTAMRQQVGHRVLDMEMWAIFPKI